MDLSLQDMPKYLSLTLHIILSNAQHAPTPARTVIL
jgi:hypothetical protein